MKKKILVFCCVPAGLATIYLLRRFAFPNSSLKEFGVEMGLIVLVLFSSALLIFNERLGGLLQQQVSAKIKLALEVAGGAAVLLSLYATLDSAANNREQQLTARFEGAIKLISDKESPASRLGGIYALERIAKDSEKDHGPVMEILSALVRTSAQPGSGNNSALKKPEIEAIVQVLSQRRHRYLQGETKRLDLKNCDLSGIFVSKPNDRNLSIHLDGADFTGADLSGANFSEVDLTGAIFVGATLNDTIFYKAILDDANFAVTRPMAANFAGASLKGTNFESTDLSGVAQGITQEQYDQSHHNSAQPPKYLLRQSSK